MRGVMVTVLGFRAGSSAIGWALVSVLGFLAWATPAHADGDESADRLLKRGVELRKAGKDDEALEAFRAAYTSRPSPRAQAQIGLAEQALGRWGDAERDLSEAL